MCGQSTHLAHVDSQVAHCWAVGGRVTCEQDDGVVACDRHKAQAEHIAVAAGIALQHSLAQGAVLVQLDLPGLALDLRRQAGRQARGGWWVVCVGGWVVVEGTDLPGCFHRYLRHTILWHTILPRRFEQAGCRSACVLTHQVHDDTRA